MVTQVLTDDDLPTSFTVVCGFAHWLWTATMHGEVG